MNRWLCCLLLILNSTGLRATTLAQFRTYFGDMDVALYEHDKPATVANFLRYARAGLYQDGIIHRCVPNFVIQGGGFYVSTTSPFIHPNPVFPPIPNEFGVGARYSNRYGTIAMAKLGGDTNSATSQWFINLKDNLFLDAPDTNNHFTVFGKVIRGTNVLNRLKMFSVSNTRSNVIRDFSFAFRDYYYAGALGEVPLLSTNATLNDLLFVDISLLNVQVQKLGNGARQVSWNSVQGKTNYVEFTTNIPPTWHRFVATNGNGNSITLTDSNSTAPRRFYRIRVEY
jgi:cyclophilin family peptidyl-prolyl cis-trans isomerase